MHGFSTNSCGVAILIKNNLQYNILTIETDNSGNMMALHMNCLCQTFLLINSYGPNTDNPIFFQDIKNYIDNYDHDYYSVVT